ncbi:uncharacterized protein LOC143854581 isoform X2 [Tasmannia lanceolata]|uniref:uncharacterized protein LOC143854581 isoform X2 n=1 Tax=Tasmannia lanceolata TaxID=3420 RepID=UPI004064B72B
MEQMRDGFHCSRKASNRLRNSHRLLEVFLYRRFSYIGGCSISHTRKFFLHHILSCMLGSWLGWPSFIWVYLIRPIRRLLGKIKGISFQ